MMLHDGVIDIAQNFEGVVEGNHSHRSGSFFTAPIMYLMIKQMGLKNILEIGIGLGSSAYWLGNAAKEIDGMYFGIEYHEKQIDSVKAWMDEREIPSLFHCADSKKLPIDFLGNWIGKLDFAYLDGDHKKEAILHEMKMVWPYLRADGKGYICIHDIYTGSKEGWEAVKHWANRNKRVDLLEIKAQSGLGMLRKRGA